MEGLAACFEDLEDPRTGNAGFMISSRSWSLRCARSFAAANMLRDMELFAREKEAFLRQFLKLEKGLPSHDTFSGCSASSIPNSFPPAFKGSRASFRKPAKASSP